MSYDELEVRDARRWSALSPKPEPKPKPKPQPELKPDAEHRLYIWREFAPDYKHGLAVAIASSEAEARRLVVERLRFSPDDWGPLTTHALDATATAWAVTGGQ